MEESHCQIKTRRRCNSDNWPVHFEMKLIAAESPEEGNLNITKTGLNLTLINF